HAMRLHLGNHPVVIATLSIVLASQPLRADEGGISFWLPGQFGSLAAVPSTPGWSFASLYYHSSVDAGGNVAFARQVSRGNITANFSGNFSAIIDADADLAAFTPTYVFATPVLGGQFSLSMTGIYGRTTGTVDATLSGAIGPLGFSVSGGRTDSVTG